MYSHWELVNYTTCIIMPPRYLWPPFIEIKKNHMNPKIKRPPYPHITLCCPFVHPKLFPEVKAKLREALKGIEPFQISFANFECFENEYSTTLYLALESREEITELHKTLTDALSPFISIRKNYFEPHIGVGFFRDANKEAKILREKYQAIWTPLEFTVGEIYFLRRKSNDSPWEVEEFVTLGKEEREPVFKIGEDTDFVV